MRLIHQIFSFILTIACYNAGFCQVSDIRYDLEFNSSDYTYNIYLEIREGQTNLPNQRIQFNSQVSFIVPTGQTLELVETFNPIMDNRDFEGVNPISWTIFNKEKSPKADLNHDYISISPILSRTAHYNDLKKGDRVKLFTVVLKGNKNKNALRLYRNGVDKVINGLDFSNGFSLGGSNQLYSGNEIACEKHKRSTEDNK